MDTLVNARIIGLSLFAFASIINLFAFLYRFFWIINILNTSFYRSKYGKSRFQLVTQNFSIWGFFTLFTICLVLTYLYTAIWQNQGIALKPFGIIVVYGRWVALSIVTGLFIISTSFRENKSFKAKYFFETFFGVVSIVFIILATLTIPLSSKIFSIVSSMIAALITIILCFLPSNKFFEKDFRKKGKFYQTSILKTKNFQLNSKRTFFTIYIIIVYITNIIIWFTSESNEIISNGLNLTNETIAYLVVDVVLIYSLTIYAFFVSIIKRPTIDIMKKYD